MTARAVPQVLAIAISNCSDAVRYAAIECMLQIQEYQDTVESLRGSGADMRDFVNFLRLGGENFRKLRQDLETVPAGTQKHAAKVANNGRQKKRKVTPGANPILSETASSWTNSKKVNAKDDGRRNQSSQLIKRSRNRRCLMHSSVPVKPKPGG